MLQLKATIIQSSAKIMRIQLFLVRKASTLHANKFMQRNLMQLRLADVTEAARTRLSTVTNCLWELNSGFRFRALHLLEVLSLTRLWSVFYCGYIKLFLIANICLSGLELRTFSKLHKHASLRYRNGLYKSFS